MGIGWRAIQNSALFVNPERIIIVKAQKLIPSLILKLTPTLTQFTSLPFVKWTDCTVSKIQPIEDYTYFKISVFFFVPIGVVDSSPRLSHSHRRFRAVHLRPAIFSNALEAGVSLDATNKVSHIYNLRSTIWPVNNVHQKGSGTLPACNLIPFSKAHK